MVFKKILVLFFGLMLVFSCAKKSEFKYVGLKVYDPVYVAKDMGFFDKENLDVKIVDVVAGGATAVQMISSGQVNGGLLFTGAICNAVANGMPIIGVADIQSAFSDKPLEEFFVRKNSGINSINDLKGKKIAINLIKASFHYTWLQILEKNGIKDNEVMFVNIPFAQQEAALEKGMVDAIGLMQPYTKTARQNNNLIPLYNAVDSFGERQFCEIIINKIWAENNKEDAIKFVSAIVNAANWIKDNQSEAKKIISKYTGINENYIDDYKFQDNAMVIESDAEYWLDYMKRVEKLSDYIKVSDIVTNRYNKYVK